MLKAIGELKLTHTRAPVQPKQRARSFKFKFKFMNICDKLYLRFVNVLVENQTNAFLKYECFLNLKS